jgi:low temperature requirement protein LtrA
MARHCAAQFGDRDSERMTRSSVRPSLLRLGEGASAVTPIELFFDLVYVFAITRLSSLILTHLSADGAAQTAILLAMVWQVWIYTTWSTNYVDPRRDEVRVMLIAMMFGSLLFASALGGAFGGSMPGLTADRGLFVAVCYVSMQLGRCVFMLWALRGEALLATFRRILPWTLASSVPMIAGGLVSTGHVHVREVLWAASVAIDLVGAAFGFFVPGLGRSATLDWTVAGNHFAERCQAFVLIALGESIVVIGADVSTHRLDTHGWLSYVVVFGTSVGLWWLYFDRAADDSADVIARSRDPGRLARDAFHWIHPIIVLGIILSAAADVLVLEDRTAHTQRDVAWLILGGAAVFLAGHAMFKAVVWRAAPVPRLIGIAVLAVTGVFAEHVSPLALGSVVLVVIVAVAVTDRVLHPGSAEDGAQG